MTLQIMGRHYSISENQKEYIGKKVGRLRKMCGKLDDLKFTITKGNHTYETEGYIRAGKAVARASVKAGHSYESIDLLVDKLEAQISRIKDKLDSSKKQISTHRNADDASDLGESREIGNKVVNA